MRSFLVAATLTLLAATSQSFAAVSSDQESQLTAATAANLDPPKMTIRVFDSVGVRGDALQKAERIADYIFGKAGLRVIWLDCIAQQGGNFRCAEPVTATEVVLIMASTASQRAITQDQNAFGLSLLPTDRSDAVYTYVFYERVAAIVRQRRDVDPNVLLGCILAHEVGHLLLGSNAHTNAGIMMPLWFGENLPKSGVGHLLFTGDQQHAIQRAVASRAERGNARLQKPGNSASGARK